MYSKTDKYYIIKRENNKNFECSFYSIEGDLIYKQIYNNNRFNYYLSIMFAFDFIGFFLAIILIKIFSISNVIVIIIFGTGINLFIFYLGFFGNKLNELTIKEVHGWIIGILRRNRLANEWLYFKEAIKWVKIDPSIRILFISENQGITDNIPTLIVKENVISKGEFFTKQRRTFSLFDQEKELAVFEEATITDLNFKIHVLTDSNDLLLFIFGIIVIQKCYIPASHVKMPIIDIFDLH